jgi:hypothetical protein
VGQEGNCASLRPGEARGVRGGGGAWRGD